jgi:hypothetical protein
VWDIQVREEGEVAEPHALDAFEYTKRQIADRVEGKDLVMLEYKQLKQG